MRGFAYLKEAGAGFTVQIVPMRENYHQYDEMVALAESLSPHYRVGAALALALGLPLGRAQPRDRPPAARSGRCDRARCAGSRRRAADGRWRRRGDGRSRVLTVRAQGTTACLPPVSPRGAISTSIPTGRCPSAASSRTRRCATTCAGGPSARPGMSSSRRWPTSVRGGQEYAENCGSCDLRQDCRWCAVYGYLEHGRYSAKVDYLCQVAAETRRFKEDWKLTHVRYYQIAGITIQVTADFPITDDTFAPKFAKFRVDGPGEDTISHPAGLRGAGAVGPQAGAGGLSPAPLGDLPAAATRGSTWGSRRTMTAVTRTAWRSSMRITARGPSTVTAGCLRKGRPGIADDVPVRPDPAGPGPGGPPGLLPARLRHHRRREGAAVRRALGGRQVHHAEDAQGARRDPVR